MGEGRETVISPAMVDNPVHNRDRQPLHPNSSNGLN
jgi:hypothetical protein